MDSILISINFWYPRWYWREYHRGFVQQCTGGKAGACRNSETFCKMPPWEVWNSSGRQTRCRSLDTRFGPRYSSIQTEAEKHSRSLSTPDRPDVFLNWIRRASLVCHCSFPGLSSMILYLIVKRTQMRMEFFFGTLMYTLGFSYTSPLANIFSSRH